MPAQAKPQLGRLIVTPFVTIGVVAAVLVWEVDHIGSLVLAVAIAAGGVAIGVLVSRHLRRDIDNVAEYYAALLRMADEQSRQAETGTCLEDEFPPTLPPA